MTSSLADPPPVVSRFEATRLPLSPAGGECFATQHRAGKSRAAIPPVARKGTGPAQQCVNVALVSGFMESATKGWGRGIFQHEGIVKHDCR